MHTHKGEPFIPFIILFLSDVLWYLDIIIYVFVMSPNQSLIVSSTQPKHTCLSSIDIWNKNKFALALFFSRTWLFNMRRRCDVRFLALATVVYDDVCCSSHFIFCHFFLQCWRWCYYRGCRFWQMDTVRCVCSIWEKTKRKSLFKHAPNHLLIPFGISKTQIVLRMFKVGDEKTNIKEIRSVCSVRMHNEFKWVEVKLFGAIGIFD